MPLRHDAIPANPANAPNLSTTPKHVSTASFLNTDEYGHLLHGPRPHRCTGVAVPGEAAGSPRSAQGCLPIGQGGARKRVGSYGGGGPRPSVDQVGPSRPGPAGGWQADGVASPASLTNAGARLMPACTREPFDVGLPPFTPHDGRCIAQSFGRPFVHVPRAPCSSRSYSDQWNSRHGQPG